MNKPDERLIPGEVYTTEQIESLGLVIKKQVHVGLICRKDDYIYFFDRIKPKLGKGYVFVKSIFD